MAGWLTSRLVPSVADCASVLQKTAKNFMQLKHVGGNADMNERRNAMLLFSAGSALQLVQAIA